MEKFNHTPEQQPADCSSQASAVGIQRSRWQSSHLPQCSSASFAPDSQLPGNLQSPGVYPYESGTKQYSAHVTSLHHASPPARHRSAEAIFPQQQQHTLEYKQSLIPRDALVMMEAFNHPMASLFEEQRESMRLLMQQQQHEMFIWQQQQMEVMLNYVNQCSKPTASLMETDYGPDQASERKLHRGEVSNTYPPTLVTSGSLQLEGNFDEFSSEPYADLQKEGNQKDETTTVHQSNTCTFGILDDMQRVRKVICSFAPIKIKNLLHLLDRNGHRMDSAESYAQSFADLFKRAHKKIAQLTFWRGGI